MASRSLALSQANLIHIYSSHFIIGKVTSSVEDLWRNVDPHFHKLPPIFCSLCFSPIHPDVYLRVCKIMKNSVFSVFSSSTPRSPTALSPILIYMYADLSLTLCPPSLFHLPFFFPPHPVSTLFKPGDFLSLSSHLYYPEYLLAGVLGVRGRHGNTGSAA